MLRNLLKISLRNIFKNTSHTFINVLGLSIGISAAIVIFFILRFDLSFDNYHHEVGQIYRLIKNETTNGDLNYDTGIPYPLRRSFKEDFPEVEYMTFVDNNAVSGLIAVERDGERIKYEESTLDEAFVMPDFFKIFNYKFLLGNPGEALTGAQDVVLSKSMAEKYFGDYTEAMGKVINVDNYFDLTVTGVVEDPPMNTDLPFKILMPFELGGEERIWESWTATSSSVQAFVKLKPKTNVKAFEVKIENYIEDHKEDDPRTILLTLQPLSDIHFNEKYHTFTERIASDKELYTLGIIGLLLLIAACINFVNLNTALAVKRSKEIGVRKVLGSSRSHLVLQFLCETALITFISLLLSLGLAELFALKIQYIIGYDLPSTAYDLLFFIALAAIFVGVTMFSGLYPAFVISGFKPVNALKNKINTSYKKGFSVRSSLIVIQLFISQMMIVAVIVVLQQIKHFMSEPIGVDSEAIVEFSVPRPDLINMSTFRQQLSNIPGVKKATFSNTGTTSNNTWGGIAHFAGAKEIMDENVQVKLIDDTYLDTYGLELLAGRNLNSQDSVRKYLINKKLMDVLGFKRYADVLGQEISVWGKPGSIIGVVKNFNTMSLHYAMQPVAMWISTNISLGAVKLGNNREQWRETIAAVQHKWEALFPNYIFSYSFLDNNISKFYENERRVSKTFSVIAALAIFIGGIGLLGLMSYMVNTRTKEIGVRKVLGARVGQIISILSGDFMKLVIIAFLLAAPLSWYLMNGWLQDFESRITIGYWIFAAALSFSLAITMLTVGYKSFKAAIINPVDVLKDE